MGSAKLRRQRFKLISNGLIAAAIMALALFSLNGCSNNPVIPANEDLNFNAAKAALSHGNPSRPSCIEASGWVTIEDGGVVDLNWGGPTNSLTVPPDAVESDVFIEITTCPITGSHKDEYEFIQLDLRPDNLQFSQPATLVLSARSLNRLKNDKSGNGLIKLLWYNTESGEWDVVQEAPIIKGKITFSITHFSKFGISR